MKNLDFEWLTDEFMLYCRSTQLREKTMSSYEQTLHLFGRWLSDELKIYTVDKITENVIRRYIDDLMVRGKYTFYVNDLSKKKNYPDRRRDYRKPVSVTTINNYIRNIRVFFNWMEREYIIRKNPMKRIRQLKHNRQAKVFLRDHQKVFRCCQVVVIEMFRSDMNRSWLLDGHRKTSHTGLVKTGGWRRSKAHQT